jgi:hypothetical protein
MVYYVIKLDDGIYLGTPGPYGQRECSTTPSGAMRFRKKAWAKQYAYKRGYGPVTIEATEVPNV